MDADWRDSDHPDDYEPTGWQRFLCAIGFHDYFLAGHIMAVPVLWCHRCPHAWVDYGGDGGYFG